MSEVNVSICCKDIEVIGAQIIWVKEDDEVVVHV